MITVKINNETVESHADSLGGLLNQLSVSKDGIAVAVNKYIIQRKNWNSYGLEDQDDITIITPTQGG